ncbi:MAG: class I SAM-dependent methyltransferase [Candidatus Tectomicrobia bacterium]|uniref:Class I SAM-dependent methyltransferase n=1 Tax=Tectimicrobiota bacterium TaxID=2528274 RepID=A0A932HUS4_UNCTE|nr:class I SAM-dependent methyltransferase [Candidatus Tectomicrobia bacterium]
MKEYDIRPKAVFDEFLDISRREAERLFRDKSFFVEIPCPACDSSRCEHAFDKYGFTYLTCLGCGSLYLSPRPSYERLDAYYRDSQAVEHWAEVFYKETERARRAQIVRPRALLVKEWAEKLCLRGTFADVGSGFGVLLEEIRDLGMFDRIVGVEPSAALAEICRGRGFEVVEKKMEEIVPGEIGAVFATNFEVIEHVFNPYEFLEALGRALVPGGVVLFTTLVVSGFDLQELWSASKSICPPLHVNLMSTVGIEALLGRCGMEPLELSTPGRLDVDILRNALAECPGVAVSRFARAVASAPEATRAAFQAFLQENRLSSHVRVVARVR